MSVSTAGTASAGGDPDRRAALLLSARRVFRDRGYDHATIAEIVREARVAQGTFYLYFQSKRDVFFALADQLNELMASHVGSGVSPDDDVETRVRGIVAACFAAARENDDLVQLVFFGAEAESAEAQTRMARQNPIVDALEAMLEQDRAAGRIAELDPAAAAPLLMGMVRNAVLEAFVRDDAELAKRLEATTADLFVNSIRAHR